MDGGYRSRGRGPRGMSRGRARGGSDRGGGFRGGAGYRGRGGFEGGRGGPRGRGGDRGSRGYRGRSERGSGGPPRGGYGDGPPRSGGNSAEVGRRGVGRFSRAGRPGRGMLQMGGYVPPSAHYDPYANDYGAGPAADPYADPYAAAAYRPEPAPVQPLYQPMAGPPRARGGPGPLMGRGRGGPAPAATRYAEDYGAAPPAKRGRFPGGGFEEPMEYDQNPIPTVTGYGKRALVADGYGADPVMVAPRGRARGGGYDGRPPRRGGFSQRGAMNGFGHPPGPPRW